MSSLIINEDLYVEARRRYRTLHSYTGGSPEYQAAWDRWVDFDADHPQIADEISRSYANPARAFGTIDVSSDRPWNEAAEYQKFIDLSYWDSFLMGCPLGSGFRAEINALITFLRGRSARLSRNKSQYGELFLIEWAIHHMAPPISNFLNWSLHQEEHKDFWTIDAFEQHLLAWASLFEGNCAINYYNDNRGKEDYRYQSNSSSERIERELFPEQLRTGGGPIAHFLSSRPDHQRYALQMFKTIWRCNFEDWAIRAGGVGGVKDTRMTDC